MFEADPGTDAVVLIGEVGGRSELIAAETIARMTKPVIAHVLGHSAPPGKAMGHAGALLGSAEESAPAKQAALADAGAHVAETFTAIPEVLVRALASRGKIASH